MKKIIIGRSEEKKILQDASKSKRSELIAITGRRRVGKTYLIKTFFEDDIDFDFSGVLHADTEQQLQNFHITLCKKSNHITSAPANWIEAFDRLSQYLSSLKKKKKLIVFFDELPWLDTHKANFLGAFDWFWNTWASHKNIIVVICGSSASWMINKVINNKGGLHNRVTKRIHLEPFNLRECEEFLRHNGITLSQYHILQLYMAMGGIPHYLKEIKKGESAIQSIHRICFDKKGLLANEFDNLYPALFNNAKLHVAIIFALAKGRKGLTRKSLLANLKMNDGGSISRTLEELEWSGFISSYEPFGKLKKDTLYRVTDEFSLFYIKFMYKKKNVNWKQLASTPTWQSWSGYAFESICLKHLDNIKDALGIRSVYTETSSFIAKGSRNSDGTQIDLLIDRKDHIINVCEIKFHDKPFIISKGYANDLRKKLAIFEQESNTRKTLFPTIISAFGCIPNEYYTEIIQQEVTMKDLFGR